jgi:isoleucyl-tRNA synthetase
LGYSRITWELGTEKELGITKEDIGKSISIEEYNEACKTVMRYTDVWNDLTEKWAIG